MSSSPAQRRVVLVDDADNVLGEESVLESHLGPGKRHRAFTAVVLDSSGRILAGERADAKLLWPGHWDVTVASHPHPGEGYVAAGERRLSEELGATCPLTWAGRFAYDVPYADVGSENELCATLVGRLGPSAEPEPAPDEISRVRAWTAPDLLEELEQRSARYCPWLFLALLSIIRHADQLGPELREPLAPLLLAEADQRIRRALDPHFSGGEWTLVDAVGISEPQ